MEIREGHNKFYINDEQGKQIAEIVFVLTGENLAIIEHTDVDESLKGQGIGKQLVAKVVEKMRREKRKIIPLCPFAKHEFDKTRERMIFAVDGRVQSHDIFHALRGVMQESI